MNPRIRPHALAIILLSLMVVLGSGAFNALTADRVASVSVSGDESALLAITPHSSADAQDVFLENGELKIQVSPGSTTTYQKLMNLTNKGTQPVSVWIIDHDYTGSGSGSDLPGDIIGNLDEDITGNVTFFSPRYGGNQTCENGVPCVEGQGNAVLLDAGETLVVGLRANTSDVSGEEADQLDEITIYADTTVDGVTAPLKTVCLALSHCRFSRFPRPHLNPSDPRCPSTNMENDGTTAPRGSPYPAASRGNVENLLR